MSCASCVGRAERAVRKLPGVRSVQVSLLTEKAEVEHDSTLGVERILETLQQAGYPARLLQEPSKRQPEESSQGLFWRALVCLLVGAAMMLEMLLHRGHHQVSAWQGLAATLVQFWGGWPFYRKAWSAALGGGATMDTLVVMGSTIAYGTSLWAYLRGHGHIYFESAVFILGFVLLGRWLEGRAKSQARQALTALLEAAPATARRLVDGVEKVVPASEVRPGDILRIHPGEKLPVDGVVTEGSSTLDESLVTGESLPVFRQAGDRVIGATLNGQGSFLMKATAVGEETVLAGIAASVERAQTQKAPIQLLVDRVAGVFVPAVLVLAGLDFVVWTALGSNQLATQTALSILLIACPCALGLAVPLAHMVGLGKAAGLGILVQNPESLEKAARVEVVVLDKTGTLTEGKPCLDEVWADQGWSEAEILRLAAALEVHSGHPLAQAVVEACPEQQLLEVEDFQALPGQGLLGRVQGRNLRLGNALFLDLEAEPDPRTRVYLEVEGKLAGWLAFRDRLRPDASRATALLGQGRQLWILSGDRAEVAQGVADELGIQQARGGLLPHEKQAIIAQLQAQGKTVAMIGDGVNDAPALAQADVSVALGWGSSLAQATADLTLMQPRLERLDDALRLARAIQRTIRQGLLWAFLYNVLLIPVAAGVLWPWGILLHPVLAAIAMTLSSLSVVLNALRLRRFT